jgi:hypothetical protein
MSFEDLIDEATEVDEFIIPADDETETRCAYCYHKAAQCTVCAYTDKVNQHNKELNDHPGLC